MKTQVKLTMVSGNSKVGAIPVSTTEKDTCPKECPMHETDCYARFHILGGIWNKVSAGLDGVNWLLFCKAVARFFRGQPWRHNQAGDLPKRDESTSSVDQIDREAVMMLGDAAKHTKGWTYTHYDPTDEHNASVIRDVNSIGGLTINLSADSQQQADEYADLGIAPVTVVLPIGTPHRGNRTPAGRTIVVCPAQTTENVNCARCLLCTKRDRKSVVGFIAHGTAKKRLSKRLEAAA
jgi:hypothetical protein